MKKELKKRFKNKIKFAKEYNFKGIILSSDTDDVIPLENIPSSTQLKEIAEYNCIKSLLLIDFIEDNETLYLSHEYAYSNL